MAVDDTGPANEFRHIPHKGNGTGLDDSFIKSALTKWRVVHEGDAWHSSTLHTRSGAETAALFPAGTCSAARSSADSDTPLASTRWPLSSCYVRDIAAALYPLLLNASAR